MCENDSQRPHALTTSHDRVLPGVPHQPGVHRNKTGQKPNNTWAAWVVKWSDQSCHGPFCPMDRLSMLLYPDRSLETSDNDGPHGGSSCGVVFVEEMPSQPAFCFLGVKLVSGGFPVPTQVLCRNSNKPSSVRSRDTASGESAPIRGKNNTPQAPASDPRVRSCRFSRLVPFLGSRGLKKIR